MNPICSIRNTVKATVLATLFAPLPVLADDGGWDHRAAIYLWGVDIGGTTAAGQGINVSFSDLAENLEFGLLGAYRGQKGKWSVATDVMYLDVSTNERIDFEPPFGGPIVPGGLDISMDLTGTVITGGAGYEFHNDGEGTYSEFVFGFRYLDLDNTLQVDADLSIPELEPSSTFDAGDSVLDAIVGIRGSIKSGHNWFIPYGFTVGAGESDLTWQAMVGVGYNASDSWDVVAMYRYLAWELDSSSAVADIDFSGPMLGAVFRW